MAQTRLPSGHGGGGLGSAPQRTAPSVAALNTRRPPLPPHPPRAGQNKNSNAYKFKIPLTTSFLDWDDARGYPVSVTVTRALLPFVSLTSGFAWMSAAAHLLVLACFSTYVADLRAGINKFRWVEYAFSSSLMIALIAMLFGMRDIISLILLGGVNACMCFFGYDMELVNLGRVAKGQRVYWAPFVFGCFAGALPWAVVFTYLGGSGAANIPAFVWAIVFVYLICFNSFPIGMVGQYAQIGCFRDSYWKTFVGAGYYHGERSYQIQSLVSKSLLLWLVVGGSNQPNEYTN
jgi:hypothetical protein